MSLIRQPFSQIDQEDHVVNADENKPPSPLSVQHDSGLLPVQSPPFDNELSEKPPSTISDYSNELELDAQNVSPATSDIEDTQPCTTTTWGSVGHQPEQAKTETPTKTIDTTTTNSKSNLDISNPMSEYAEAAKRSEPGNTRSSVQISSLSRTVPVKKSVQQLYGQPSWWGDGEDNYSYPHTSLLGSKEPVKTAEKDVPPDISQVEPDTKPQPRSEAFVIDFGSGRGTGESPGTLSQCIPDRLRRGFDERERLKREREKENELRRQTIPAESSPMRQNSQRSTRSVTLRAANAKLAATGRPSTASAGTTRVNRPSCSTSTRPSTAATGRRSGGSTNPSTALLTTKSGQANSPSDLTPRRAAGSVPSSPLVRNSRNSGSASVTPRQSNLSTTREVVDGAINRVSALQTTATRAGVASGRRPTVGSSGQPGTPRRLSHRTDVSNASRRTAPPGSIQPMGTIMTKTGLTVATRTPKTPTKPTTTTKTGGGLQSTTRNFMSATASSGAKRVQPSLSNRPPTGSVTHSQSRTSAVTAGPMPSNSTKRPVTTTQLRRPASSTRAPVRRTSTDVAEKYGCVKSRGNLMRATSDVIETVMATIDAYDDPKAYLFYRMFQGADETEPSTDSVFKTFIAESPSESASKRGATIGAVPQVELNAALAQKDWLLNHADKGRTLTSPNLASPSMMKPGLEDAKDSCSPTTPQVQLSPQQPPDTDGSQSKLTHLPNITQPTISSSSPKVQHRPFPKSTENAVNVSMLVGTSVASLAGTYILEKGTALAERDLANATVDGDLRGSTSLVRSHDRGSMDQVYSHGNLSRLQETEEERVDSNPDSRRKTDLEARSHRTYVTGDNLIVGTTQVPGEETGPRLIPAPVRSAGDGSRAQSGSITPGKIILNAVEAKHSPSPGSGVHRGPVVLLKRPERSPSTSSTPPSAEILNDGLLSTAKTCSPLNVTQINPNGDTMPPKPCASPELVNGPRSTYTPLTDIHNCYRALQQSVNFLIQSQSGLLPSTDYPNYNDEDVTGFGLAGTTLTNECENFPLRIGQTSGNTASHTYQIAESRMPCSSAAVWPPDLMYPGATGTRRSLSQRHRADRKRQSTASLDSALQRWDDSRAETPQLKHRSFRGPKSTGTHTMHKNFLFKSGEDPEALRLSLAMDRNIMASGDSGLQSYSASLSQSDRKSHLTVLDQTAPLTRSHAFRTGFASVPEPASPTGSGSSHSGTNGWSAVRRPHLLPEPNRLAPPGSGDATVPGARTINPLNRTYDFTAQNGPLILSRGLHVPECGPAGDKDIAGSPTATKVPGGTEAPTFDSRTFTRRKGVDPSDQNETPTVDPSSYQALVAGMSAISQGIDSLAKAPLFRTVGDSNALRSGTDQTGSTSDLPDSTTGPPTEPIRSAFVTPIPQRSLGIPYTHPSGSLSGDQTGGNQIPEDSSTYYTLMVDSIRHLSLKLRQCSDKLIQRVNAEQNAAQLSSPMDRRTSRASSTDSVPASTKFALSDALENMRMINQQLKLVDELLFSQNWNELHPNQQHMSGSVAGNDTPANLRQSDTNHFSFVPIGRDNSSGVTAQSVVGRALHPTVKSTTQTKTSTFVLPGQVPPHGQTVRPSVDEEDEYY